MNESPSIISAKEFKCLSYTNINSPERINHLFHCHNISSSNTQTVSLEDKNIFPQSLEKTSDRVYHITLKSNNSLSISSFVRYNCLSNKIAIKALLLFAYDLSIKESKLITLALPNVTLSAKSFNLAKMFAFSINMIASSSYMVFVILLNLVFIISIKAKGNRLTHEILHKVKMKGNRLLYLGHQLSQSEIMFYILSKPNDIFISFKCAYEMQFGSIAIRHYENTIEKASNMSFKRYTQLSCCKWTVFYLTNKQKSILVNKDTYEVYEMNCDSSLFASNALYLISNKEELNILRHQITNKTLSIFHYKLVIDEEKNECNVSLIQLYEIQGQHYGKYAFNIINDQCFYVNFYSHFVLYYLNERNNKFEFVHNFAIGNIFHSAQVFNINSFRLQENVHVMLETFKDRNIVFFEFKIHNRIIYSYLTEKAICEEDKAKETKEKRNEEQLGTNAHNDNEIKENKELKVYSLNENWIKDKIEVEVEIDKKKNLNSSGNQMKIIQRKDNYPNHIFPSVISLKSNSKSNVNIIETSYLESLSNNNADKGNNDGNDKEEEEADNAKETNNNETEKSQEVVKVKEEDIREEKRNDEQRGEEYINQIISSSKLKFDQLSERTKALDPKQNQHLNALGTIFQQVLSHPRTKEQSSILKSKEMVQTYIYQKKLQQQYMLPLRIENSINESFNNGDTSLFSTSTMNNLTEHIDTKQMFTNTHNNINTPTAPINQYQQGNYPNASFNPIQPTNSLFQGNNTMQCPNNINYSYPFDNSIMANWQKHFNRPMQYFQQQMSAMNYSHQPPTHPYAHYPNNSNMTHIRPSETQEIEIGREKKKKKKKQNYCINKEQNFLIVCQKAKVGYPQCFMRKHLD